VDPTRPGQIWAFDPGSSFTGLAGVFFDPFYGVEDIEADPATEGVWLQEMDVRLLYDRFQGFTKYKNTVVLVEDYSHGGSFTLEAKRTLKVVGFLENQLRRDDYELVLRHKDKRLSGQGEAARIMNGTVADLKKDPRQKDGFSALSHCITYYREMENLRVRNSGA
jgi:hypothetical protein